MNYRIVQKIVQVQKYVKHFVRLMKSNVEYMFPRELIRINFIKANHEWLTTINSNPAVFHL